MSWTRRLSGVAGLRRSSTCPSGFRSGATASGYPPTVTADAGGELRTHEPQVAAEGPFLDMTPAKLRDGPRPASVSRRTEALVASVTQHHRAISAHQSQLLAAVVELDRRKAWRVDGATSMVAWLVQRCGVSASTALEWVTAADKLRELPRSPMRWPMEGCPSTR